MQLIHIKAQLLLCHHASPKRHIKTNRTYIAPHHKIRLSSPTGQTLVKTAFFRKKPNQKRATDVTEFSLFGQKLYLSPILDLHNGYLVSYTLSQRPVLSMVTTMLEKASETIPNGTELILHSDRDRKFLWSTQE